MAKNEGASVEREARGAGPTGPMTIYVAWHPKCQDGKYLARGIYDWFRNPSLAVQRSGSGIPVYYRSHSWKKTTNIPESAASGDFLRDIYFPAAAINVVIPLIDEHMVDDQAWRDWLYDLAKQQADAQLAENRGERQRSIVALIPVQLHHSIARLDPLVSGINAIRVDNWNDDDGDDHNRRRERRRQRIRRYLVQTLVRTLRRRREPERRNLLPRSVFLSHAKGDLEHGVGVAEKIRVEALTQGQVDTFFDASQLDFGKRWRDPMTLAAGELTAAFIAIFSDLYPTRYWCREEIRLARRPRNLTPKKDDDQSAPKGKGKKKAAEKRLSKEDRRRQYWNGRVWSVQPIVIVDTLGGDWSHLLPEMSGAPIVRWTEDAAESAAEVLDRVMLEALRSEVQVRHAMLMAEERLEDHEDVHFLTWVPDAHTLMEWAHPEKGDSLLKRDRDQTSEEDRDAEKTRVIFPGHGLGQIDETRLRRFLGSHVIFESIEEFANRTNPHVIAEGVKAEKTKGRGARKGPAKTKRTRADAAHADTRASSAQQKSAKGKASIGTGSLGSGKTGTSDKTPKDTRFDEELPLIALSVGDPDTAELYALGYGSEHLDDAVYRIATSLLEDVALAYGGVIRSAKGFLDSIIDAVAMISQKRMAKKEEERGDNGETAPREVDKPEPSPATLLHSFQAWDFYLRAGKDHRASHHGLCTFHDILPASTRLKEEGDDKDKNEPKPPLAMLKVEQELPQDEESLEDMPFQDPARVDRSKLALYRARALTRMRLRMSKKSSALLAVGGKEYGWSGFAPGVLEEICLTHRQNLENRKRGEPEKPILILPEFGGAARAMAAWILKDESDKPFDLLRFDHQWGEKETRNPKLREIVEGLKAESHVTDAEAEEILQSYYDELQSLALSFRREIRQSLPQKARRRGGKRPTEYFGLTPEQLHSLMTTSSMGLVRYLLKNAVVPYLVAKRKRDGDPVAATD